MIYHQRFKHLLDLYISGKISLSEHDELFELLSSGDYDELMEASFDSNIVSADVSQNVDLPAQVSHDIISGILQLDKRNENVKKITISRLYKRLAIAATLLLTLSAGVYLFYGRMRADRFVSGFAARSSQHRMNSTGVPRVEILPDGSRVTLQPGASLFYSSEQFSSKREVYMSGEAFFKISKNPLKPFYVYYNNMVTKVLGTSFSIRTDAVTGNVEVAVRTGKVQVYENTEIVDEPPVHQSLIVTPNQKALYKPKARFFEAKLVDDPLPLEIRSGSGPQAGKPGPEGFVFENAKMKDILHTLEQRYSIEIMVNNEDVYNCLFSGDVSRQNLYDQLKIICLATDATYEINGTRILVQGKGCKN